MQIVENLKFAKHEENCKIYAKSENFHKFSENISKWLKIEQTVG